MFCQHCGSEISDKAVVCVKCGFSVGSDHRYCAHCGSPTEPGQAACPHCGFALTGQTAGSGKEYAPVATPGKSKLAAGLLGIFLGGLGLHNFYLGRIGRAVTQLTVTIIAYASYLVASGILYVLWPLFDPGETQGFVPYVFLLVVILVLVARMAVRIWTIVEGILILTGHKGYTADAKGVPLSD